MEINDKITLLFQALRNFTEDELIEIENNCLSIDLPLPLYEFTNSVRKLNGVKDGDIVEGSKVMVTTGFSSNLIGYVTKILINDRYEINLNRLNKETIFRYKSELILLK